MRTQPSTPRPPQFQLHSLLIGVAVLAVLFGWMRTAGETAIWATLSGLLLVGCHVFGNVLGTRMRDQRSVELNSQRATRTRTALAARPALDKAPAVHLGQRAPLGRLNGWICGIGICTGAVLGGMVLMTASRISVAGWAVGSLSAGIVGGFVAFLCAGFVEMSLAALRQGIDVHHRDKRLSQGSRWPEAHAPGVELPVPE